MTGAGARVLDQRRNLAVEGPTLEFLLVAVVMQAGR
jgi:hypothetical protein